MTKFNEFFSVGLFFPYDPVTNPTEPVGWAFSAGKYQDGSETYVGKMILNIDSRTQEYTGRLSTSVNSPGVYYEPNRPPVVKEVYYLDNNYFLVWAPLSTIDRGDLTFVKFPNTFTSDTYFYVGRYNLSNAPGSSYTEVGRFSVKEDAWGIKKYDTSTIIQQILVCSGQKYGGSVNLPPNRKTAACPEDLKRAIYRFPRECPFLLCNAVDAYVYNSHAGYKCVDY